MENTKEVNFEKGYQVLIDLTPDLPKKEKRYKKYKAEETTVTFESDLTPEIESEESDLNLIKAIITQAIDDTMSNKQSREEVNAGIDAYIWITKPEKEFLNYCRLIGRNPQTIIDHVKENSRFNHLESKRRI